MVSLENSTKLFIQEIQENLFNLGKLTPILHNLFQKINDEKKTLPNSFYEVVITWIPKLDKDSTEKGDLQNNIPPEGKCKVNKRIANWIQQCTKIIIQNYAP